MTELTVPGSRDNNRAKTARCSLARGIRIDMTPMVDLGFLLISFFIFTTALTKPAVTNLMMPHAGEPFPIAESRSVTILLGAGERAKVYDGILETALRQKRLINADFDEASGVGNLLRQRRLQLENQGIDPREMVVLIKPSRNSSYKTVIKAMDEMLINSVTRYAIVDQDQDEENLLEPGF